MGFGAGHIQDMNNRIKQNRAQRPSKKSKFKENNREGIYSSKEKSNSFTSKAIPKHKLLEIKRKIRKKARSERKKEIMIYGIAAVLLIITCFAIYYSSY